jgi:hypothetical protein
MADNPLQFLSTPYKYLVSKKNFNPDPHEPTEFALQKSG